MKDKFKKLTEQSRINKAKYESLKRAKFSITPRSRSASVVGTINAVVSDHIARSGETKYVAENIVAVPLAVPPGQSTVNGVNCARMIPRLTQGADDYQRIGNRIQPTKGVVTFNLNIANPLANLIDQTVNIVIFRVKGAYTDTAVGAIPGGDFLRVGDGTNIDPRGPLGAPAISQIDMLNFVNNYRVNSERYTLLKWKRFLFKKGPNDANGAVGAGGNNAPPTVLGGKLHRKFSYAWQPPQLKYDNNGAVLPTNHYPVYLIWTTTNDASAPVNAVFYTTRAELFFKDT